MTRASFILLIVWCFLTPAVAQDAAKKAAKQKAPKRDVSEEFFTSGRIPHVRIQLDATNLAALKKDNRKYARCAVRDGETVYEIDIR